MKSKFNPGDVFMIDTTSRGVYNVAAYDPISPRLVCIMTKRDVALCLSVNKKSEMYDYLVLVNGNVGWIWSDVGLVTVT